MRHAYLRARAVACVALVLALAGCGGGGGDGSGTSATPARAYTIWGNVTGLIGAGLRVQSAGEELAIGADGAFRFATQIQSGKAYAVTVATQPSSPEQFCAVTNGQGTMPDADVTGVAISCGTIITASTERTLVRGANAVNETLLNLAEFTGLRLTWLRDRLARAATEPCPTSSGGTGVIAYEFTDVDTDGALSVGDRVTFALQNCWNGVFGGEASGRIELNLQAPPTTASGGVAFAASASIVGLALPGSSVEGTVLLSYADVDERHAISGEVTGTGLTVRSANFASPLKARVGTRAGRTIDFVAARYAVQASGEMDRDDLKGRFSWSTPTALSGRLGNFYPDAGVEELRGGASVLSYKAQAIDGNNAVDATLSRDPASGANRLNGAQWSIASNGTLWRSGRGSSIDANALSPLDVNELGSWRLWAADIRVSGAWASGVYQQMPVSAPIRLFYNAVLDPARIRLKFVPDPLAVGATEIPARVTANGGMIVVTGERQLEHGVYYELRNDGDSLYSTSPAGSSSSCCGVRVVTRDNLRADATPSPAVAAVGATVSLKSTRSVSTDSRIVRTTWRQTAGAPVTLVSPSLQESTFVVPAGAVIGASLAFELTVEDANGETDTATATVFVVPSGPQTLYYHRRAAGTALGVTPESPRLYTAPTWTLTPTFNADVSFGMFVEQGSPLSRITVLLASGAPPLAPGTYTINSDLVATAYVTASDLEGCSGRQGQLVIRELERSGLEGVARFAADFETRCPGGLPTDIGSVRINSLVPLP